jgi:hypothetical protein
MANSVVTYFNNYSNGETTLPSKQVLLQLSPILDQAMGDVIVDLTNILKNSPEHQARVNLLTAQPRAAGTYDGSKVIFDGVSPFEQTVAIESWLTQRRIRNVHTFFLSTPNDYIPAQVKKIQGKDSTLMHTVLGSTRGMKKAPKYEDWADNDPINTPEQKVFIDPLKYLEVVRQPYFSSATIFKSNSYDAGLIDSEWRYGKEYACVELKGQSKNSKQKIASAALNACALLDLYSDVNDPNADDRVMTPDLDIDEDLSVTVGEFMDATKKAIVDQNMTDLTQVMENLFLNQLEEIDTPLLEDFVNQKKQANDKNT